MYLFAIVLLGTCYATNCENLNEPKVLHVKHLETVDLNVDVTRYENSFLSFNTRAYNSQLPGPTIRVNPGTKFSVHLRNNLGRNRIDHVDPGDSHDPNLFHAVNTTNLHTHGLVKTNMGLHVLILMKLVTCSTFLPKAIQTMC